MLTDIGIKCFNIKLDVNTNSYDVAIITETEYGEYIKTKVSSVSPITIERNEYNSIPYQNLMELGIVEKYFYDYVICAVDFPEEAYNKLDSKYREAKFGSLDYFKEYVKNNSELNQIYEAINIDPAAYENGIAYSIAEEAAKLDKYAINVEPNEGYTQYICIDKFGNYYIFKITNTMQYSLMLDTYTIDLPEFVDKYYPARAKEKVILNINKFIQAVNDKDYRYAYRVLADSFKQNTFKDYATFETYMKTKFFAENKVEYVNFGDQSGTYYTYEVKITDATNKSNTVITKTFIMLIENGTDFKLSFNV